MPTMSDALAEALDSDCGHSVEVALVTRLPDDFAALVAELRPGAKPARRTKAINMLARWGDRAAVEPISALLPRLSEMDRAFAVDAIGRLGGTKATRTLCDLVDDPSPHVRKFVAYGLRGATGKEAVAARKRLRRPGEVDFVRAAVIDPDP